MLYYNTPIEDYRSAFGLLVKREDLSCSAPPFSKTRGVFAHIRNRPELVIGVLDTYHSQGGWAVARACMALNRTCVNFYPVRKAERNDPLKPQQRAASDLGAKMVALPAGRSAILYHQARRKLAEYPTVGGTYMMPNALKLPEMVEETADEVERTLSQIDAEKLPEYVLISISSGTIAAGAIAGFYRQGLTPKFLLHQGYSRPEEATRKYIQKMSGVNAQIKIIDEGYAYGEVARGVVKIPPFPSNKFYDLKAWQWWIMKGREEYKEALLWNIG